MIRPNELEAGEINSDHSSDDKYKLMGGEAISFVYDKKLPEPVVWSSGIEEKLNDQFIIYAGGCDGNEENGKNITDGNTFYAVGCDRLGALYRDTVNNIQYYNHKVYLQLKMKSEEPIRWNAQEATTKNVQEVYEDDSKPSDFTLRARVLFRKGTGEPEESEFAGASTPSLTKWSCFKQMSVDVDKRIWNILMPHGAEGEIGTLWLYLEDYVGNKGVYQIKNGSDVDKFVWNDEPPKVKLRTVADYPATYDTAKTETNASKFSSFGTYRHYSHLAFTDAEDIKRLVPPTIFKKKYITTQTSNMSDSRYSAMINEAEADGLVMNDINVIGDVTYVGNTADNVSGGDYAREEVGNNTYAVNPVLCFFDIDVSDSPSGIDGYRYCFGEKEGDDNRQSDSEGNRSDGHWYINHTGGKDDSKRVNAQVPVNLSYIKGATTEYNQRTFNLYIRDRVGNVSVTKLGNLWMMDNSKPATADGSTWTGGKANPGNSYLSLPGADSRKQINVTIAGSSEAFKTASDSDKKNPYSIRIPADWFTDFQERTSDGSGTGKSSGVYGAGLIPNVKGSAKPIADGYLTVDIPYFIYNDANATTAKTLEYYIFDNTGNYWTCNLNVKVDDSAPTMRVGVTKLNDTSAFHTPDSLYKKVYGSEAKPSGVMTWNIAPESLYQGSGLNSYKKESGYSNNGNDKLYSLASNVSKQYESKSDVDNAYQYGTPDEKSRFFKIRSNNAAFFVNVWAVDDGGISQVSIRKWGNNEWVDQTDQGKIVFTNENQNVKQMLFEKIPDVVSLENNGKEIYKEGESSIRNSIYVSTAGQSVENLYEVSATDFAGNAVFYYAYILPYDNKAPTATTASVTGNTGSSVVGGKFYFNELKFSLSARDTDAGLGAYQWGAGTDGKQSIFTRFNDDSISTDGSVDPTGVTEIFKNNDSSAFWVKLQDILGNVKTVDSFTVNGGDTPISNANFVYDNVVPSVSFTDLSTNFKRTGNYWNYDSRSWGESSDDTGVSTNSFLNYEASSKSLLVTNRDYSSKIEITPTGTDTSGIKGYVMTETSAAPASLATVAASFVFEAGKELSTSFEERKISLANTSGLTVYFWAVDYAGNVSTSPAQLTIKFDAKNPDVSPAPSEGKIEVKVDSTKGTRIWSSDTHNYYNDAAYIEVTLAYKTGYEPKGWKILKSSSSKLRSDQLAYKDFVSSDHEQLEGNLRKYKIYLPALINDRNNGDDFYISFYSNSDSPTYSLVFADKQKWYYDKVVPSAPQIQGLAEGAAGMYYDGAGKLYFKSDASGTLNFTATDNGTVKSGFAGVKYSTTESAPVASVDVSSSVALTGSDLSGKTNLYFYAYDNVWNASSTSYKLALVEDNIPPTFTVSVDDSSDYVYKKDANIYYNAEHKPESIVFTCSSSDSDLAEFICTASGVTVTQGTGSDSNKFTVSGLGASGSVVLSFKAKDKLGNVTSDDDVVQVTLVADSESPSGLAINKIKGIPLDDEAKYIYAESADWKTVSGGTVYCKADQLTDLVNPFEYVDALADAGSGLKEGSPSASKAADGDEWTITAMDNVGNKSTFTVTLIRDGVAPTTGDGSTQKIRQKNTTVVDRNYKTVGSYSVLEGEFYELKDKANPENGDWITWLYSKDTKISIPISDSIECSSEYSYSFTYGTYDDNFTSITPDSTVGGDTWSDYVAVSGGNLTVTLPEVSAIMHGHMMIWLKDRVGNISCPYNIGSPNNAQQNWIGMYSAPTGANAQVSGNTLTIENYPASAGIKSVMLVCDKEVSDTPSVTVQLSAVNGSKTEYQVTDARATKGGEGNKTLTLTLPNNFMTVGTVTAWLTLPNETTVTSIKIVDASDHISDEVIATRSISGSFFSKMSTSVSNAIGTLFGRTYEDKNLTSEQRKQLKAEKKAARQAEIAAAKEAKKQAKLLAKQQKEEARKLRESISVLDADAISVEEKSVSAGTAAAALSTGETIIEANATGIDQWSNAVSGGSALKKGEDRRVPVAPVAAAVALLVLGSGAFVLRRRRQK
ncbi:MAG: hypothetical protein KBS64_03240 [Treponema sp.]|nr:hypothetical protein [Candidatus Treponema equi]